MFGYYLPLVYGLLILILFVFAYWDMMQIVSAFNFLSVYIS